MIIMNTSRLASVILLAAAATASAQSSPSRPASSDGLTITLTPKGEHTFESDLKGSDASVSITRAGLDLNLSAPLNERLRLRIGAETEASWYNFKDSSGLLPSGKEPIEDAYLVRFSPGLAYGLNDRWGLLAGAIIEFAGESDADFGDSITYGGFGGLSYKVSDTLSVTFGAIVKSRLEDDTLVVPLLGLRWQINEKLTLSSEQLGLRLTARINPQWSASIFARYEIRDFRLADDGSVPDGVVEDMRVPVGVGITFAPVERFSLTLSAGVIAWQRFEFIDDNGDRVDSIRSDPTPFVGLRGELTF